MARQKGDHGKDNRSNDRICSYVLTKYISESASHDAAYARKKTYRSIRYSRRSGESIQYPALRKWPRNLAFSTPEATWEVQARVQRLPLSEPFDLAFSFLFHGGELRNTFTVIASAVHARYNVNAGRVAWRVGNTYAPLENKSI